MLVLGILVACGLSLAIFGGLYSSHLARVFGEIPDRRTPAETMADGVDYVPTKTPIVFAHHFASIAGAGPIVGPVIGLAYGWLPAILWIVIGAIVAGAVHDFASTFVSVRERGKSIAVIARQTLGMPVFILFILLLIVLMVLVTAMFIILSTKALTSVYSAAKLELPPGQTLFQINENGEALVGGIATTSVLFITALAPIAGWLYLVKKVPVLWCSMLAMVVCGFSVYLGIEFPVRLPTNLPWPGIGSLSPADILWMISLGVYCMLAAALPVWIFLQSRDFLNVHILYTGIAVMILALCSVGFQGVEVDTPLFRGAVVELPTSGQGSGLSMQSFTIWPFMFITIACGACSGFHSLCATGTTSKQVTPERAARQVGYYAMLLESFLAVCVVCCLLAGFRFADYSSLMLNASNSPNPVLTFAVAVGHVVHKGLGIPVAFGVVFGMLLLEGFVVTTLDTAVRLARYLFEELWATIFARYDVFAERNPHLPHDEMDPEIAPSGTAGIETAIDLGHSRRHPPIIRTAGIQRAGLLLLAHPWFNTLLIVGLMLTMAFTGYVNALWQLFGAGNQLLAGLALLVVSTWLAAQKRSVAYTLIPAVFMLATTLVTLGQSLPIYYRNAQWPLFIFDAIILALTTLILWQAVARLWGRPSPSPSRAAAA